ncbi:hypothetical protein SAMN05661012_02343 [Chitinophaga sancti]|uniref:Uncharacterized protein n=1 Tax=Chitinophaga sancti TaxID=1004 RepID=A0A1K1PZH6_9BACT|nr:hypothetical protein SAMN05661012_02343 [Chitinophaga sancti]
MICFLLVFAKQISEDFFRITNLPAVFSFPQRKFLLAGSFSTFGRKTAGPGAIDDPATAGSSIAKLETAISTPIQYPYSIPFVLGNCILDGLRFTAILIAFANTLKIASIL